MLIMESVIMSKQNGVGTINATPSKKHIKMYGQEEPKLLDALLRETTANKAELVDTLVLLDGLPAMASLGW